MKFLRKDLFRTIKKSIGRFIAIAGICALGVGFFAGLQMTCGDMKQAVTTYYNNTNMMDIRVVSSLGIDKQNIQALKDIDGVSGVMPAYETDILADFGIDKTVVRLHSLSDSANKANITSKYSVESNDNNYINRQILTSGQWPKNAGECCLSADIPDVNLPQIGDEIEIKDCSTGIDQTLSVKKLKVVGFVHSSYYVGIVQMGQTKLGKGLINNFAYVPESTFAEDLPYTEAFVKVENSSQYITGSEEYQNCIDDIMFKISEIAPDLAIIRTASIKSKAQEKLDEAKQELEQQKNSAFNQFDSSQQELKSAWDKINDGKILLQEAEEQWEQGYIDFINKQNSTIDTINQGINSCKSAIAIFENLKEVQNNNNQLSIQALAEVGNKNTAQAGLLKTIDILDTYVYIDNSLLNVLQNLPDIPQETYQYINTDINNALTLKDYCQQFYNQLQEDPNVWDIKILEFFSNCIPVAISQYSINEIIDQSLTKSTQALQKLEQTKQTTFEMFNEIEKQLLDAKAILEAKKKELKNGEEQYYLGLNSFISAKNEALQKFADAQAKIDNSQNDINSIEDSKFYVMDRSKNFGAINYLNDADRIASIANIFPLLFFFVALLVALTSMTRMVDEERISIGTHKALGLSKSYISLKFILYAVISSFFGSIIGILILSQVLPWVIMYAYNIIYKLPIPIPMPYNWILLILSLVAGVGLTLIATVLAANNTLKQVPARLMIPAAPKAGKRIFLEYIKPLWNIFNFNWKITWRNMFLYKRRLLMTIVGIAGCSALLITGFGLHDSINDIMVMQFDNIATDNLRIDFETNPEQNNINECIDIVKNYDNNCKYVSIHEKNMIAQPDNRPDQSVIIVVPQNVEDFQEIRNIRHRESGQKFEIKDDEVYVSEKIANLLNVSVGDQITLYNQDLIGNASSEEYRFVISGIFENYIAHYVLMTQNTYNQHFNEDCIYNSVIASCNVDNFDKDNMILQINNISNVKSAFFNDENRETYTSMLRSVNMVVIILIVAAAVLAFVVLYNLININICERMREIATYKVLGGRPLEINFYIHRETFLLSLFGCIVGILLGFLLEYYVVISSEVDYVMFGRNIYWYSIVFSILITLGFTIIVVLLMSKKLFSISMVESLKSVE